MAGRWIDNNQDQWRPRYDAPDYDGRERQVRSWEQARPDKYSARRNGLNRDPVFGERESGASYGNARRQQPSGASFASQDYTGGGRYYGDDSRERIYREEYGQGGREYGDVPRGYDAGRGQSRQGYGGYPREPAHRMASGGTGGYDYERGYGDAGRRDAQPDRGDRFEDAGRSASEFFHKAGERVASWFGGGGEARAFHDYGDRGHRGRGPQGYKRSDQRISDDVHDRLTDDTWLDASKIVVAVNAGEVTLTGTVDDRDAKHRAERIVEDVAGVTHVQNNLRRADGASFTRSAEDASAGVQPTTDTKN